MMRLWVVLLLVLLDPDQARQNADPDLDLNFLKLVSKIQQID